MPLAELCYVIAYDIRDDRRRSRLAKVLDDYGTRVQYSVYEAVLDRRLFDNLVCDVQNVIDPKADRITIYPLCAACALKRLALGQAKSCWPSREVVIVI